ncbi:hypothetical protein ACIOEX_26275 [Streptomyces sp. NPDC087850]|uniref:hypothetical protein n=1 Tax=Streptomyces sp. NPDC087850 TaxID=3365809 RepID=UPI0038257B56
MDGREEIAEIVVKATTLGGAAPMDVLLIPPVHHPQGGRFRDPALRDRSPHGRECHGPARAAADFTGCCAPAGGEPVGYRGATVPGPWSDTEPRDDQREEVLGETARSPDDAARLIGRLAAHRKHSI